MLERRPINVGNGTKNGNVQLTGSGASAEGRTDRNAPVMVLFAEGCVNQPRGSQVQTVTCGVQWGTGNQPAFAAPGPRRSYLCGRIAWGLGGARQVAEFDWRQGTQLVIPAGASVQVSAWIQEFVPDPGIQLVEGALAPQRELLEASAYDGVSVLASLGQGNGPDKSATKTYPQQTVPDGDALWWRIPAFARSVRLYSAELAPVPASGLEVNVTTYPDDTSVITTFDAGVLGEEIFLPGGATHVHVLNTTGGPLDLTPVFNLEL